MTIEMIVLTLTLRRLAEVSAATVPKRERLGSARRRSTES